MGLSFPPHKTYMIAQENKEREKQQITDYIFSKWDG